MPDLREYLDVVRNGYQVILGGLLLGLIGGFVYAWTRPPVYEATATLLISRSKIGVESTPPAAGQAFRAFVVNKAIVAKVQQEFGLDRPPQNLDPVGFINDHLSVEEIVAGDLVRVHVRLADAALAAKVANRLVQLATDLSRRVNTEESLAVRDFIKAQLDESFTRLQGLERNLVAYKREAQLELRRDEVDSLLDRRRELLDLSVQLEGERASLRQAEQELVGRSRVLPAPRMPNTIAALAPDPPAPPTAQSSTVARAPATPAVSPAPAAPKPQPEPPPAPRESDRGTVAQDDRAWLSQAYSSPMIDPVYEILEYRAASGRVRVADLERRRRLLADQYRFDRTVAQAAHRPLFARDRTGATAGRLRFVGAGLCRSLHALRTGADSGRLAKHRAEGTRSRDRAASIDCAVADHHRRARSSGWQRSRDPARVCYGLPTSNAGRMRTRARPASSTAIL